VQYAVIGLPLVAALLALLPVPHLPRAAAIASGVVQALLGVALAAGYSSPAATYEWAGPLARVQLQAEGFAATLITLGGVLGAVGAAASRRVPHERAYFALWSLLQAALGGVLLARDLVLFFVMWEAMLVPLAFLMWLWGSHDARGATLRFLLYTMAGSAFLLAGIVSLVVARESSDLALLAARPLGEVSQTLLAAFFVAGFAVKLPLFPFHAWLPRAYAAAPLPVTIVLSGIVAKTAAYGVVAICLPLFPNGMARLAPALVALAAVGALYGAILATRQRDLRTLIAYASLSHLNVIALAVFTGTAAASQAALVASVSHGLEIAALFLLAGILAQRAGGWSLGGLGGVAQSAPVLAAFTALAIVVTIGVPGTSGFAGEILVLAAAYARFPGAATVTALVMVLSAVYGLGLIRRAFHGPSLVTVRDLDRRERILIAPLLVAALALGVAPWIVSDRMPVPPPGRAEVAP